MIVKIFRSVLRDISPDVVWGVLGMVAIVLLLWLGRILPLPGALPELLPIIPPEYAQLTLEAHAAVVYDVSTGRELFDFNGDAQLPLASLTKIMMAVTVLSRFPEDTPVTIPAVALQAEGDSGLFANERWALKDLLGLTLVESSNDGANAIAEAAGAVGDPQFTGNSPQERFVSAMNAKAQELGLTETYFLNPSGLDETVYVSGGYGSAHDVAILFAHAVTEYPKIFEPTRYPTRTFQSLSNFKHTVKNTNTVVNDTPGLIASKTGYTDLAGGNLTIAFNAGPDRPIVISVLGSTEKGRFTDTQKLVSATLEFLKAN